MPDSKTSLLAFVDINIQNRDGSLNENYTSNKNGEFLFRSSCNENLEIAGVISGFYGKSKSVFPSIVEHNTETLFPL